MQIKSRIKTAKPESKFDEALEQELLSYSYSLASLLNKGLEFGDNFNAQIKTVTSDGVANTEFSVTHTLKRIPSAVIVLYQDKAGSLYQGPTTGTAWTVTTIYLKSSVASVTFSLLIA